MRGDDLILPGVDKGQADRTSGRADSPYTDMWAYKSGKRPKSISLEKMLYLWEGGEHLNSAFSNAVTLFRRLVPHH